MTVWVRGHKLRLMTTCEYKIKNSIRLSPPTQKKSNLARRSLKSPKVSKCIVRDDSGYIALARTHFSLSPFPQRKLHGSDVLPD